MPENASRKRHERRRDWDHQNVCTIHEIGQSETGQVFIAMSYYKGETLSHIIKPGPLPIEKAVEYTRQIAEWTPGGARK